MCTLAVTASQAAVGAGAGAGLVWASSTTLAWARGADRLWFCPFLTDRSSVDGFARFDGLIVCRWNYPFSTAGRW